MLIGYARTSTAEQIAGLEAQERDLRAAGVERLYQEQTSAAGRRGALTEALDYLREGDTLAVTKLDRLARSVADLVGITKAIEAKKASLKVLNLSLDIGTPTGKLMLNLLGSVAEFERDLMLERQREGIAKAKAEKRYKGRKPTAMAKADQVQRLAEQGLTRVAIAEQLGIGVAGVYRALKSETSGKRSAAEA